MNIVELDKKSKGDLVEMAKEMGMSDCEGLKKRDIIMRLLQAHTEQEGNTFCSLQD